MKLIIFVLAFTSSLSFAQSPLRHCEEAYKKIYRDNELNISIFLGYSDDDSDFVTDPYDRMAFIDHLTMPCNELESFQLCGFRRDPDDADVITKTIVRKSGQSDKVKIRILNSAYSKSHSENLGPHLQAQKSKTQKIHDTFLKSLAEDEVVFYNGHARRGTGPGFKPMTKTDWALAIQGKPSLNAMSKALKDAKTKPALIGMITCEGEHHYGKALNDSAPDSALLLTRQTTSFNDSTEIMNGAIASILRKDCAVEFRQSIKDGVMSFYSSKFEGQKPYEEKLPEVYGLFEPLNKKFEAPRGALMTIVNDQFETHSSRIDEQIKNKKMKQPKAGSSR